MMTFMAGARRIFAATLAFSVCLAGAASAEDAAMRANRSAYEAAIKCFIANGIVAGDKREDGDKVEQAVFEGKARESFEIANKAGAALGYTGSHINEDFGLAQASEMPRLVKDSGYFKRTAAICKGLGLM